MTLHVSYSDSAAKQIAQLRDAAAKSPHSARAALYQAIKKCLTELLTSERHALNKKHALRKELAGVFRRRLGGRYRLFYIVSSQHKRVIVLFIGYRKEGGRDDAYEVARKRILGGEFDGLFDELGVKRPGRRKTVHKTRRRRR